MKLTAPWVTGFWTIVRGDDEDGIVELAGVFEIGNEFANLIVHGFQSARMNGEAFCGNTLIFFAECVPTRDCLGLRRQSGAVANQADLLRALPSAFANIVPTRGIGVDIVGGVFARRGDRNMDGIESEIGEEGFGPILIGFEIGLHLVGDKGRGIKIVWQTNRLAIFKPGRVAIIGQIGLVLPAVRTRRVKDIGAIKAMMVWQFTLAMT